MPEAAFSPRPASGGREVVNDYAALGFSLKAHPVSFLRSALQRCNVVPAVDLAHVRDGARVRTAGLVLVRQRPGSAKGVMFVTSEAETGPSNSIVWPKLIERHRRVVFTAGMVGVEGRIQREGGTMHVIASRLVDLSPALARVGERGRWALPRHPGDGVRGGGEPYSRGLAHSASGPRRTSTPTCWSRRRRASRSGRGISGERQERTLVACPITDLPSYAENEAALSDGQRRIRTVNFREAWFPTTRREAGSPPLSACRARQISCPAERDPGFDPPYDGTSHGFGRGS